VIDAELIPALLSSRSKRQQARGRWLVFLDAAATSREWDGRTRPGPLDPRFFDVSLPDLPEEEGIEGG
jgi:hypothetical protein